MASAAAAAATAATGAAGVGAFSATYNRENFQFDSELRFQRFTLARTFANAQTSQYREDIRGMTELTVGKQDTIYTVSTLFMCVCAALSCAGRIGMHGSAPPSYLCALYTGHIFTCILYLTLAMWLALHASLRAQCGMVSLLTRKVRLPIPSLSQLDQARNFGSAFEKQQWGDIVRVPFMSHPQAPPDAPEESSGDSDEDFYSKAGKKGSPEKKGKKDKGSTPPKKSKKASKRDPREEFGSTNRSSVPSWIRDEQVVDKGMGIAGGKHFKEPHDTPEHFDLYLNAQCEWWPYDVYARIAMLYGVMQFLFATCYYIIGTSISELRAFWIMWAMPAIFIAAQVLILRLDTVRRSEGQQMLPHLEWAGHLAPYFTIIACTLDYRLTYTPGVVTVTWGFVYAAFFGHFLFAIRMLDIAWPLHYRETDMPDLPGKEWWPASWKLPPAFSKALWIVAPPKKLEPGQHCLINEMKALARTGGGVGSTSLRNRKGSSGSSKGRLQPVPLKELRHQVRRLDRHFEWWGKDSVLAQVSERYQKKLIDLQFDFGNLKNEVKLLTDANSSPAAQRVGKDSNGRDKYDLDRRNVAACQKIQEIEERLEEIEAANKVEDADGTRSGGQDAYTHRSAFKDYSDKRGSDLPWQLTRISILTTAGCWLWMILGTTIEISLGAENILKPPGEPPWIRDQKLRHWKPDMIHFSNQGTLEGYRLFKGVAAKYLYSDPQTELSHHLPVLSHLAAGASGEHAAADTHSGHRRLAESQNASERVESALNDLLKTLPTLGWLAHALDERDSAAATGVEPIQAAGDRPQASPGFMAPAVSVVPATWPSFFEPQHLACSPVAQQPHVVALTSRGFGAMLSLHKDSETQAARSFALDGISELGPLAGATWAEAGLWLIGKAGKIAHCPGLGPNEDGTWTCQVTKSAMPLPRDSQLASAAIMDSASKRLLALQHAHLPQTIEIFADEGHGWSPAGQIHMPPDHHARHASSRTHLVFDGTDLLIMTGAGEVHRRSTVGRAAADFHPAPVGGDSPGREWRAACALPAGRSSQLLRLALRRSETESGFAWLPELITAA